jgi:hypothetical protein
MVRISRLRLAAIAIVAIPIGSALAVWHWDTDPDRLGAAIKKLGFYPLRPPTVLRAPGSIYHVSADGKWTSALCEADPSRLKQVMRESATEETISKELKKASFRIDVKVAEKAGSNSDASILQSVNYSLEKVKVLEVSIEELANIADELQQRPGCQKQVIEYLTAGDYVCQVQQVLLASATYAVSTDAAARGAGSVNTDNLHAAIKANIDPNASHAGTLKVTGDGLYYGMKFAPRCLALLGQIPPRLATNWYEKALVYVLGSD